MIHVRLNNKFNIFSPLELIDRKHLEAQFETTCKNIVDDIMDKFIDLGVDDNHSNFGEGMAGRQLKFKSHLEKMQFEFKTTCLDLPKGDD